MNEHQRELAIQIQYRLISRLTASIQQYRKTLDVLQECIFECRADLQITFANTAWYPCLGYEPSSLVGQYLTDYMGSDTSRTALLALVEAYRGEENASTIDIQLDLRSSSGEISWFSLRMQLDGDTWTGSLADISQRLQIEAAPPPNDAVVSKLTSVESLTDRMEIVTDRFGKVEWVNKSFEATTGYTLQEIIGRQPREFLLVPKTTPAAVELIDRSVAGASQFNAEMIQYKKNGEPFWAVVEAKPVFDDEGTLTNFIGIQTDVTEQRAQDKALKLSDERVGLLLSTISDAVIRTDAVGNFQFANRAFTTLTGFSAEQATGRFGSSFLSPDDIIRVEAVFASFVSGEETPANFEIELCKADGGKRWFDLHLSPVIEVHHGVSRFNGIICRMVDIQDRHLADETLRKSRDAANSLVESKSRFLAKISHEVRTPLNAIVGITDLLQETILNETQRRYLNILTGSSKTLLELINGILDLSKFESSSVTLEKIEFDLLECVEDAVDLFAHSAVEKQLEVIIDVSPGVPVKVIGDQMRLRQVIVNLVANAVKFTSEGFVTIGVTGELRDAGATFLFTVTDSGRGIEQDRISTLFDEYTQESPNTARSFGGTGLGLAICREICAAAGGTIECYSTPDQGSTFSFTFPLGVPAQNRDFNLEGKRLTCLSKSPRMTLALSHLAVRERMIFTSQEHTRVATCDFLIVDDLDRVEDLTLVIDSLPSRPVVVHLTLQQADPPPFIHQSFIQPGPFKPSVFLELLAETQHVISRTETSAYGDDTVGTLARSQPTVLVVEDQAVNQFVINELLSAIGFKADIACNGVEAVAALKATTYPLVLMDIQMPEMDGITATRKIRALGDSIIQPKIVAVTANGQASDKSLCLEAGMDGYLTKPLNRSTLLALMETLNMNGNTQ